MDEYIKREEAIAALTEFCYDQTVSKYLSLDHCLVARDAIERAVKVFESLPAADVEPVQEWIPVTDETKPKCPCLVIDVHGNLPRVAYQMLHYTSERFGYFCCDRDFEQMATDIYTKKKVGVDNAVMVAHGNRIAYWMPLPPLPKGE